MEITKINTFLDYYERIRSRTRRVIETIPPDKTEWTYKEGKFTLGDLVRHIACIERYMYAETVSFRDSKYRGCGKEYADGLEAIVHFFDQKHVESMEVFKKISDQDLTKKCPTPGGIEVTMWKWLRAMVEHEVHHRGQIYMYLGMLGIKTPPLFGMTSEEVIMAVKQ